MPVNLFLNICNKINTETMLRLYVFRNKCMHCYTLSVKALNKTAPGLAYFFAISL